MTKWENSIACGERYICFWKLWRTNTAYNEMSFVITNGLKVFQNYARIQISARCGNFLSRLGIMIEPIITNQTRINK